MLNFKQIDHMLPFAGILFRSIRIRTPKGVVTPKLEPALIET